MKRHCVFCGVELSQEEDNCTNRFCSRQCELWYEKYRKYESVELSVFNRPTGGEEETDGDA